MKTSSTTHTWHIIYNVTKKKYLEFWGGNKSSKWTPNKLHAIHIVYTDPRQVIRDVVKGKDKLKLIKVSETVVEEEVVV